MSNMNKKIKRANDIKKTESIFSCPICRSQMRVCDTSSFVCTNRHTFNIAKQGYVNFLDHPIKTNYGKDVFEGRRAIITQSGLFAPLYHSIADVIACQKAHSMNNRTLAMLDTGCGEGSHLSKIYKHISSFNGDSVTGVGIDISKEGILAASKKYEELIWSVADLANTPFNDRQFDVLLNILSPANYKEFKRLLTDDGIVIKVVPRRDYLKEVRQFFFDNKEKQTYSNADIIARFTHNFHHVKYLNLRYTQILAKTEIQALVQMTPLTWDQSKKKIHQFLEKEFIDLTVDLDLLIGRKTTK